MSLISKSARVLANHTSSGSGVNKESGLGWLLMIHLCSCATQATRRSTLSTGRHARQSFPARPISSFESRHKS